MAYRYKVPIVILYQILSADKHYFLKMLIIVTNVVPLKIIFPMILIAIVMKEKIIVMYIK